jgi:hypothetical protein
VFLSWSHHLHFYHSTLSTYFSPRLMGKTLAAFPASFLVHLPPFILNSVRTSF